MNKVEFMQKLKDGLAGLSPKDREEQLNFYSEMIDDRMEEGLSEEEAVAAIGSVKEIVSQIVTERYYADLSAPKKERPRLSAGVIVLLLVGSPLWITLAAGAFSGIVSILATIWSVAVSFWAVFGALIGTGIGTLVGGILYSIFIHPAAGLCMLSGGLVCIGLSIFAFYGCIWTTKATTWLMKIIFVGIKNCFVRKEKKSA